MKYCPCAIVPASCPQDGEASAVVVPVMRSRPADLASALELAPAIKQHLGLDTKRSWVVLTGSDVFD